jgi:CubicO group peptidase (beta-lactamase class C family)
MQRQQVPGLALGIFHRGQVVIAKGYGYSNLEHQVPVSSATVFQTASVGKQFSAVAVMLQVEDGKLSLDDPITRYFPDAPASWRAITARHLLTHTSGLADYLYGLGEVGAEPFDWRHDYTEAELLTAFYRLPLEFEPGAEFSYSNTGYALLGFLVHRVSGQFYGDLLRDRVFKPLGMKTARVISEADLVPNRAAGYQLIDGAIENQEWYAPAVNTTADGALYLSLDDYVAWDRGLRAQAILTSRSWAEIYSPVRLKSGKTYPYGFGWDVDACEGKPWYHHSGSSQGFTTYISRYLADDLTLVVLTNLIDASPARFIDGIATIINPGLAKVLPSTPIPDSEPAVAERVRRLLDEIAEGKLPADELLHARRSLVEQINGYASLLQPLGRLERLELLDRRAMGDEKSSTYAAHYAAHTLRVDLSLAPDDRVSDLEIQTE